MARRKSMVVKDGEGVTRIEMPEAVDLRVPQKDERLGVIPEYVNITRRVQLIPIADQPGETLTVPPMGVLKGAQWEMMARPAPAWGKTPYFMERELSGKRYDEKYLLSTRQMLDEIGRLGNRDRIRLIVQNAVIDEKLVDDESIVTRLGYRDSHMGPIAYRNSVSVDARPRRTEDRKEVTGAAMERTYFLEDQERKAQEAADTGAAMGD